MGLMCGWIIQKSSPNRGLGLGLTTAYLVEPLNTLPPKYNGILARSTAGEQGRPRRQSSAMIAEAVQSPADTGPCHQPRGVDEQGRGTLDCLFPHGSATP